MTRRRYISPYFSSIGLWQSALIFLGMLTPFRSAKKIRVKLSQEIGKRFNDVDSFAYTSARGALAAVFKASELKQTDEVLLSSFTCLAVPTAVIAAGATPTYCDINPYTMNVTPETVVAAVTSRTKIIVVQHTLGSIAPVEEIKAAVKGKNILVIEDCALSYGSKHQGLPVGSRGDAGVFSMELSKTLTTGWGGILIVKNKKLAQKVAEQYQKLQEPKVVQSFRMALQTALSGIFYMPNFHWLGCYGLALFFKMRLFGRSTPDAEYKGEVSDNFILRLAKQQCALALHQWKRTDQIVNPCVANFQQLKSMLIELGYTPLGFSDETTLSVSPRISFLVSDRDAAVAYFHEQGIELGVWFDGPLSPLPDASIFNYNRDAHPMARMLSEHIVNLVCHRRLSALDMKYIKKTLMGYQKKYGKDTVLQQWVRTV